ncbi:uncharacterized protein LOC144637005 [Oculina patagonica]
MALKIILLRIKITLLLFLALHDKFGPLRDVFVVAGSDHDIWPFDDLADNNMDVRGNVVNKQSPVGKGIYLDGSDGTFVKLKGHEKSCLGHPSDCDITIGFFLKWWPKSYMEIYFGNKDADLALYEGVNIYQNGSFRVAVYGKDKYCSRAINPPRGVWFFLGLVWERVGRLAVYYDSWYSPSYYASHCGDSPSGLKTREDYFLGRNTFPIAYYKDLNIWYSIQPSSVFDDRWDAALENDGSTEIGLKIIFSDLPYDSGEVNKWETDFSNKVIEIYDGDDSFTEVKGISFSDSDGNAAVSFKLIFTNITWESMLKLQLALEDGAFLGSPGIIDEDACETDVTDKFICEVPKNPAIFSINYHAATVSMDPVSVPTHEKYFYGYYILFKNLDDPNSSWRIHVTRNNEPPIHHRVHPLVSYTNYSFRVSSASFKSAGLISEALPRIRTTEWVPAVGPSILAYRNTSSTSIYVQWTHSIPQALWRGILIGYRVAWSEDYFSSSDPHNSEGHVDVGLDVSDYTVTSLHEHWLYDISVAGRTSRGAGIYTRVTLMTDDDAPSKPPSGIELDMVNETTLNASWNEVDLIHQNGVILGYRLRFQQEDGGPVLWSKSLAPNVSMYVFPDLLIFQNYSIQLMAFTIKGDGPWSEKVYQMTDESTPINSPVNLAAHSASTREINVSWTYIENPRQVLGHLQGFVLYILEANASDFFPQDAVLRTHDTDTRRSTTIGGLEIFRLYNISIAARTVKGAGPINESVIVRTDGDAPGAPPQPLAAYNTSTSSLYASWQEIVEDKRHGIIQGYKLFFYEVTKNKGLQSLENRTYDFTVLETNFTGLKTYTKYRIEVLGFNNIGDSPFTAVEVFTDEGSPSQPPSNFTAFNRSSTKIKATWGPVPECCQFGIIRGYHVTLIDPNNASATITKTVPDLDTRFVDLKKFYMYQLSIDAFTSRGVGPSVSTTAFTDQDVPDAPPQTFFGYNISQTEIQLHWTPVPQDKVNGIVISYNVSYKRVPGNQPTEYRIFNGSQLQGIIDGLKPFTIYELNVKAFTIKGGGPSSSNIEVKTEEEAPQVAPATFYGINSSSTSIVLNWDPIPEEQVAGILRSFYITYRQLDTADNTTYNITIPITNVTVEITNLRKYTNYSLEIKGVTKFFGAATEPIIITTDEDIPSKPPQEIQLQNSSSTSILVQWKPIPEDYVHGILLGITLFYRSASRDNSIVFSSRARRATEEDWSEYTNITLPPNALSYEMTSLKKFTNYSVVILGFTSKGDGNVSHQFVVSTDEDVPSMPPSNFLPISRSGDFKMEATWGPVPDGFVHGILLGYHIYYTKIRQTNRAVSSNTDVITVGPYDQNTTILLLNNFAIYDMEIAAFTIKGDGVRSEITDGSTCNCPREFKTTWYPFPPYIKYEDGEVGGFIPLILDGAVQYCCSDCLLPNGKSASVINFELDGKDNPARKFGVEELISSIDYRTEFSVPVNGYEGQTHYSLYRYVKLAESPGVAFITVMDPYEKSFAVANVFIDSWPLLLISSVMMLAAGIVMWITESRSNKKEFPRSFTRGAPEGFWWAFVTSTTVGYGDRCPRGVLSRFFAIAWTFCGLVIIAILTGKVATVLTDFGFVGPYVPLYGAEVAAIANNSDFRLGVRKNARVNTVRNYKTYEEISQALADQEVKGALVDLYVLSSHKHLFDDPRFRIVRVYDYKASYGVVLAGHSMKLEECFTEHIKAHAANVYQQIEDNIKILKEPDQSPAEQQSTDLFLATSPKYITAVIIMSSLLLLVCLIGLIYEIRRRMTSKVLKQSKDLKNEMSPLVDSFLASIKKKVEVLSKRHRKERTHVMRAQRERDQQATIAVNKFYQAISLRDIQQEWSTYVKNVASSFSRRNSLDPTQKSCSPSLSSVKNVALSFSRRNSYSPAQECSSQSPSSVRSVASSPRCKTSNNSTLFPFTESTNHLSPNVTPTRRAASLPLRRKHGFALPAAPVPLEPKVRVLDETTM